VVLVLTRQPRDEALDQPQLFAADRAASPVECAQWLTGLLAFALHVDAVF